MITIGLTADGKQVVMLLKNDDYGTTTLIIPASQARLYSELLENCASFAESATEGE